MSILFEVKDSVATIVLNRPEAMNSLDPESLAELNNAFGTANRDESVRWDPLESTCRHASLSIL